MQKKYNILTFADFPLPSYKMRAHRAVLFIDYAPADAIGTVYLVSPFTEEQFHATVNFRKLFFRSKDFKSYQYSLIYRIGSIIKLFKNLLWLRIKKSPNIDFIRVSNTYLSFIALLTQKRSTLLIADCCDFYFDLYREFGMPFSKSVSKIIFLLEKHVLKRADLLFVDTAAQRDLLIDKMGIDRKRCVVLPNGILLGNFPYVAHKDEEVMKNYKLKDNDIVLFYGGDISEMDGIELLFRFISDHKSTYNNIKLIILGKGNEQYLSYLKSKIISDSNENHIILDSYKPYEEAHSYISIADVCIAPFKLTATSNTVECGKIISYLLLGKHILATRANGIVSLYKEAIEYFEDGNYADFSQKLIHLMNNPASDAKRSVLRKLGERFDFKRIIEHELMVINTFMEYKDQDMTKYDYFL